MSPGTQFCPYCGADLVGGSTRKADGSGSGSLDTVRVFVLLYGVVATGFGLIAVITGLAITEQVIQTLVDQMKDINPDYASTLENLDVNALKASLYLEGGAILASGVCALLSSMLVKRLTNHPMATVLCAVASILSVGLFPLCVVTIPVGLYMTYRIYKSKSIFSRGRRGRSPVLRHRYYQLPSNDGREVRRCRQRGVRLRVCSPPAGIPAWREGPRDV